MESFTLDERDKELLEEVIKYMLENKFFKIEGLLGFKISSPDKMKYMKIEEKN